MASPRARAQFPQNANSFWQRWWELAQFFSWAALTIVLKRGLLALFLRVFSARCTFRLHCGTPAKYGQNWELGGDMRGIISTVALGMVVALAACAGRAPQPVATVQPQDSMMNCPAIFAEIQSNNNRIQDLGREQGWKVAQNVVAGVAGLAVPILWFGMDWQGAAGTEARALQDRQSYLAMLATQKHCGTAGAVAMAPPKR
jgi:hypothetical protein